MSMWARKGLLLVMSLAVAAGCGDGGEQATSGATGAGGSGIMSSGSGGMIEAAVVITSLAPQMADGGLPIELLVSGEALQRGDVVVLDGQPQPTEWLDASTLRASLMPLARGNYAITVQRDAISSNVLSLEVRNTPPTIGPVPNIALNEEQPLQLAVTVDDFDGDPVRVFAIGLPPGARWDEASRTLHFTPDFIQGGQSWPVVLLAQDGEAETQEQLTIVVNDSITPPAPQIVATSMQSDHLRLTLSQLTDDYLDSPGYAGRTLEARVVIPLSADAQNQLPVRVFLHGFGGSPFTGGLGDQFRVYAHDPENTYWWGYSDQLPGGTPTSGTVPNYTQRRVLHLIEWLLNNYPGADPNRVYATGGSMGGAGAAALGLLYARHFSHVYATIGQKIPRNHRPARIAQLQTLWGSPQLNLPDASGMGNWDRGDMTRALLDVPEARQQMIFAKHGKDDPTIHFGAVTIASPLTNLSFYQVLQQQRIGHYVVWDEGGHGSADPVMGANWWDDGYSMVFDPTTFLRRDLPFVAFSNSSADDDPGDGSGNGQQTWSDSSGYAGTVSVAGDSGWNGVLAGARNRYLRWDSNSIVDEIERLEIPLLLASGMGGDAPQPGYPPLGDQLNTRAPITADATIRRAQLFVCMPGEMVRWSYGAMQGEVAAGPDGAVTIPALPVDTAATTLVLERI